MSALDNFTIKEVKEILSMLKPNQSVGEADQCPFEVGQNYLIRTVTFTLTGRIKSKTNTFLVLEEADWIADTGRFSLALQDSENFSEVEPFKNDAIVSKGSIVDATKISKLIREMR